MNKSNKTILAGMLKNQITEVEAMCKNGDSKDWIISYLRGVLNVTIFILIVKNPIFETSRGIKVLAYKKDDRITVSEDVFELLQKGHRVERFTQEGVIRYDKNNFENEVNYTKVTVEYGVRKLGQRKSK